MTNTKVLNLFSGLLPALCVFLAAVLPGAAAWAAEAKPAGEFRIAQAQTEEERNKRRAARQKGKEGGAAAKGEARAARRKAKREGGAARAAKPGPRARPAAKRARPAKRAAKPARPARPAVQPARPAKRAAQPARPATPPAAVARRNPKPAPHQKRRRSPIRKLERNVRKFLKRSLRDQRRVSERRAAERRDVIERREDFRRRDAVPRRFRDRDALRPFDGRGVGRREPDRRRIVEPHRRERLDRRDRDNWRRREFRRSDRREARRYARSRRHVVRARRYRNRFKRGRSIYYLPPAGVALAASLYALDSSRASYDDYYGTFMAPPVRRLRRRYSLNDVVTDPEIRAAVRSVNIDTITFYSGSSRIQPNQLHKLEDLADAIHATLRRRPDEVFLIAGHTDAVGTFDQNLALSERRSAAVQQALIEEFGVPEENLESVGYGEQYLRIDTDAPDRRNRRVVVRAIGALLARR